MEKIVLYALIGLSLAGVIAYLVYKIIKIKKMTKEEKLELLKTYLKGIIAFAEQKIVGSKRGQEKLKMVEEYFKTNAPLLYKILLLCVGKDNLQQFIEEALTEIKESFTN